MSTFNSDEGILDYECLSDEDKEKVQKLYADLQHIFDKYSRKEDGECENSGLED